MDVAPGPSQSRGMLAASAESGEPFEAMTLEDVLNEERIDDVDLLKIDIEGGEHEVLAATPRSVFRRCRTIAMEYHPNGSKEELLRRVVGCGFAVTSDVAVAPDSGVAHLTRVG